MNSGSVAIAPWPIAWASILWAGHAKLVLLLGPDFYAARTVDRKLPTSCLRRLLSADRVCAAVRTCEEADPVSVAPRCTSVILEETCCVPCDACCTLRA